MEPTKTGLKFLIRAKLHPGPVGFRWVLVLHNESTNSGLRIQSDRSDLYTREMALRDLELARDDMIQAVREGHGQDVEVDTKGFLDDPAASTH